MKELNKGIKALNKDEENNNIKMLRNLTYVSKINKSQKEMNKISQILSYMKKFNEHLKKIIFHFGPLFS